MHILNDISLKPYNTFGIDVNAKQFVAVSTVQDLRFIYSNYKNTNKFILGGGSNMLLTKPVNALVIQLNLKGKTIVDTTDNHVLIECQAGENWHEFVKWTLKQDFGGLEKLSLIPGNVATSPIQNMVL